MTLWVWTFLESFGWFVTVDLVGGWRSLLETESSKCSDIFVKNEFVFRPETRRSGATGHLEAGRPITVHHKVSRSDSNTSGVFQETSEWSSLFSFWRGLIIIIILNNESLVGTLRSQPSRPSTMMTNTGVRSIIFFSMSMMSSWSLAPSMNSSRVISPEGSKDR